METAEVANARVITLMSAREKAALEQRAQRAGISVGEFVRRSLDAFDPGEAGELAQLSALAAELAWSNREAEAALDRALASIEATRAQLNARTVPGARSGQSCAA